MLKKITFAGLGLLLLTSPLLASADTLSDLQAYLAQLTAQLAALQQQIAQTQTQINTTGSTGTLTVSTDAASPSYQVVAGGSSGVVLGAYRFSATGENVRLERVRLYLSSGATPIAYPSDLTQLYIYDGSTLVGTTVFAGGQYGTIVTLSSPVTVPRDAYKVLTVKGDIAPIGLSQPGKPGDLIQIGVDTSFGDTKGTGASSGNTITATGSTSLPSGVRIFRSYPTVALDPMPYPGNLTIGTFALIRFKVTANSSGDVGLAYLVPQITASDVHFSSVSTYVYTDSAYSQPAPGTSQGNVGTVNPSAGLTGTFTIPVSNGSLPIEIPAGQTYYFQITGNISSITGAASVITTLPGDASYVAIGTYGGNVSRFGSNYHVIWSPNDTTTSQFSDADWTNSYGISGIPASGISQIRVANSGPTPPPAPSPSGTIDANSLTAAPGRPTITGTASNTNSVTLAILGYDGGTSSVSNGHWSIKISSTLPVGTYNVELLDTSSNLLLTTGTLTVKNSGNIPAPSCTVNASPSTIKEGQTIKITWTSKNTSSATLNGQNVVTSGTQSTLWLAGGGSATYTLTVTGPGGTSSCTDSIKVNNLAGDPSVNIRVNGSDGPVTVAYGASATLSWSSKNTATCGITASAPTQWAGNFGTSGGKNTGPLTKSLTYTIQCEGNPGTNATDSVTINVSPPPAPSCTLKSNNGHVKVNQSYTLSWTSKNATSADLEPGAGAVAINGSQKTQSGSQGVSTYTLTVTGAGGTATCSATVNIATTAPGSSSDNSSDNYTSGASASDPNTNLANALTALEAALRALLAQLGQ